MCNQYEARYVHHENLSQRHFYDGVHLSRNEGIALYVRNLKEIVNPLLGVKKDDQNNSGNNTGQRNLPGNINWHPNRGNYKNNHYQVSQSRGYGYNNMYREQNNNNVTFQNRDFNMRLLRISLGL